MENTSNAAATIFASSNGIWIAIILAILFIITIILIATGKLNFKTAKFTFSRNDSAIRLLLIRETELCKRSLVSKKAQKTASLKMAGYEVNSDKATICYERLLDAIYVRLFVNNISTSELYVNEVTKEFTDILMAEVSDLNPDLCRDEKFMKLLTDDIGPSVKELLSQIVSLKHEAGI